MNDELKPQALKIREELENTGELSSHGQKSLEKINQACAEMTEWVYQQSVQILNEGKIPAVVGGDHSSPEGLIRAICERERIGVLHVDAHADLRVAYQGFTRSHASIMYNVMSAPKPPEMLVQVAIRDFCEDEFNFITENPNVSTIFDKRSRTTCSKGELGARSAMKSSRLCPRAFTFRWTSTDSVPSFVPTQEHRFRRHQLRPNELLALQARVSGQKIAGFDLNEVLQAPTAHPNGMPMWGPPII